MVELNLASLLRWSDLLPQLQSLDILLSAITWRERFVALCLSDRSMEDRNKVLKWGGESLTGLRWQVVSAFCREVSWLTRIMSFSFFLQPRSLLK